MAVKCYTDEQLAAIIAASQPGALQILASTLPGVTDDEGRGAASAASAYLDPGLSGGNFWEQLADIDVSSATGSVLGGSNGITENELRVMLGQPPMLAAGLRPTLQMQPTLTARSREDSGLMELVRRWRNSQGAEFDEKYGPQSSGAPNIEAVLPPSGSTPSLAPTPTLNSAGYPDEIIYQNGGRMNGFSCPSPSVGTCFSDIPRADVSDVITFPFKQGDSVLSATVDLDNVRGMNLCSISGILGLESSATVPPAAVDGSPQFYQSLFFYGTYTLTFRGQTVPGWTDRPLSEIISDPLCCDPTIAGVDCLIPEYGALEIEIDLSGVTMPPDVNPTVSTRLRFSGCECHGNSGCGCGCGGGGRRVITQTNFDGGNPQITID